MTERIGIDVIEPGLDADAACDVARTLAPGSSVQVLRGLWYPYLRFDAECAVGTLAGRRVLRITCLVDGLTGLAASAPRFESNRRDVPVADRLVSSLAGEQAVRTARRFLSSHLGRRLRTLADFDTRLLARGTVYTLYWLVAVDSGQVLVDSLTGGWITMSTRAA